MAKSKARKFTTEELQAIHMALTTYHKHYWNADANSSVGGTRYVVGELMTHFALEVNKSLYSKEE